MKISEIGERELINNIWKIMGEKNEDEDVHFYDLGKKYLLLAMDTINEGFHFEKKWDPELIGRFLVDVNLSDVAAKNGNPLEMMASFSFPRSLDRKWVTCLMKGIKDEVNRYGMRFAGGDLKESDRISLTGLVMGEVEKGKEFRRSGARPGDYIYITSKIGKSEIAILNYHKGKGDYREILDITPRMDALKVLRNSGVTSCIDNSDGIYKSLSLIAQESKVKMKIERDVCAIKCSEEERKKIYSIGGDYELIFTSPELIESFPLLGVVEKGEGVVDTDKNMVLQSGYDHFMTEFSE